MTLISEFDRNSPPYLFSTECPWIGWPDDVILEGKRIITVAGSGDIPFYLLYRGVSHLISVDVSHHACAWSELKRVLLKFTPLSTLRPCLENLVYSNSADHLWRLLKGVYFSVRFSLSSTALNYWDRIFWGQPILNVFQTWLRPTDVLFIPFLFYIQDEETYKMVQKRLVPYPIITSTLEYLSYDYKPLPFADIVYCSNICEYLMADGDCRFHNFLEKIIPLLSPGGIIMCYETQNVSRVLALYKNLSKNYRIVTLREFKLRPRPGFIFRHCLVGLSREVE